MEKFTPKTIDELNAEFEARMEEQRAHKTAAKPAASPAAEEKSCAGLLDSAAICANDLEAEPDEYAEKYYSEEVVETGPRTAESEQSDSGSSQEISAKTDEEPRKRQENEYGEPDPHGYFGAPIDKSRPRRMLSEETSAKMEPKFDFERTSDYSGAMLQNSFTQKKDKFKGARIFTTVLIVIIAVVSLLTAAICLASAHPGKFIFGRSVVVCENGLMGSNISAGSLCIVRKADKAAANEVAIYRTESDECNFAFGSTLSEGSEVYAVAVRRVPYLGRYVESVTSKWVVYACSAAAAVLIILIIRLTAFSASEQTVTDGVKSKKSRK